jgi:hypothetical protein
MVIIMGYLLRFLPYVQATRQKNMMILNRILVPRLIALTELGMSKDVEITIDAEEQDRLGSKP